MKDINAKVIALQCPQCGCALELTVGHIKSPETMTCSGCGVGISTDTGAANAATDIRDAAEKIPAEITVKFIDCDCPEKPDDGA